MKVREPVLAAYVRMMPRLRAERQQMMLTALLAAGGRTMNDRDRDTYLAELERQASGAAGPRRAPKATLSMLERMGVVMAPPPEEGGG